MKKSFYLSTVKIDLKNSIIGINVLLSATLLISCLGCYVSPTIFWPLAFIGFSFPILWLLNLGFTVSWLFYKKRYVLISGISILLTVPFLLRIVTFSIPSTSEGEVKIMSYNVKNFDLYNWSDNLKTREKMFELIQQEHPDILNLQEFYNDTLEFQNLTTLKKKLSVKYHHYHQTTFLSDHKRPRSWGLITFSKFPIIHKGFIKFENSINNACIYTDMVINEDTVRVYNMHLQSIHLSEDEYQTIEDLAANQNTTLYKVKLLIRKMKKAYIKRSKQVDQIAESVQNSPFKVILLGDFNDIPISYSYQTLSKNLEDAFISKGNGIGETYSGKLPYFRIDYIFVDPRIRIENYYSVPEILSDHYPIVAGVNI